MPSKQYRIEPGRVVRDLYVLAASQQFGSITFSGLCEWEVDDGVAGLHVPKRRVNALPSYIGQNGTHCPPV